MSTYIICTRCGRPMRPMYSDGTGAPTNGYCQCAPATSWGDVPLIDWRDAELSRLRIQVEQMRIDTIKDREAFAAKLVIEADTLRAELAEARADVARFEAALDVANQELAEVRRERDEARENQALWYRSFIAVCKKRDKKNRTIRALVVAARVARLAAVGFAFIAGIGPRRVHDEIRFGIKQADRQAEKE